MLSNDSCIDIEECSLDVYALQRLNDILPSFYNLDGLPNLRQCVGTKRLWGASLGFAFYNDIKDRIKGINLYDLIDIAIFSRSILVLEDCLNDEYLDSQNTTSVNEFIYAIEHELFNIFERIGEPTSRHLTMRAAARQEISVRQYKKQEEINLFRSSINKSLIFFNPYRLLIAQKNPKWKERIHFLELFFFACQLLDDYQDLREDRTKKLNHNIFYSGRSDSECTFIEASRLSWVAELLEQIYHNINREDAIYGADGSFVFLYYQKTAVKFLNQMLAHCHNINLSTSSDYTKSSEYLSFENWNYNPCYSVHRWALNPHYEQYIRPEFMQIYSSGIRSIKDI